MVSGEDFPLKNQAIEVDKWLHSPEARSGSHPQRQCRELDQPSGF